MPSPPSPPVPPPPSPDPRLGRRALGAARLLYWPVVTGLLFAVTVGVLLF
ncbi:hypothetical protein ACPC54_21290 [Kitasatospora sp. NPDC094028]